METGANVEKEANPQYAEYKDLLEKIVNHPFVTKETWGKREKLYNQFQALEKLYPTKWMACLVFGSLASGMANLYSDEDINIVINDPHFKYSSSWKKYRNNYYFYLKRIDFEDSFKRSFINKIPYKNIKFFIDIKFFNFPAELEYMFYEAKTEEENLKKYLIQQDPDICINYLFDIIQKAWKFFAPTIEEQFGIKDQVADNFRTIFLKELKQNLPEDIQKLIWQEIRKNWQKYLVFYEQTDDHYSNHKRRIRVSDRMQKILEQKFRNNPVKINKAKRRINRLRTQVQLPSLQDMYLAYKV